jgi:hypothetical protein
MVIARRFRLAGRPRLATMCLLPPSPAGRAGGRPTSCGAGPLPGYFVIIRNLAGVIPLTCKLVEFDADQVFRSPYHRASASQAISLQRDA